MLTRKLQPQVRAAPRERSERGEVGQHIARRAAARGVVRGAQPVELLSLLRRFQLATKLLLLALACAGGRASSDTTGGPHTGHLRRV